MGKSFNIVRVATPKVDSLFAENILEIQESAKEMLGDQLNFGWALPAAFNALANPLAISALPRTPDKSKDFFGAIAYWHSLQWLLIYRLGWAHPGKGLSELLSHISNPDIPLEDTLELVREVWFEDGYLEHYLEWARSHNQSYLLRRPEEWDMGIVEEDLEMPDEFERHTPHGLHLEFQGYHYFTEDFNNDSEPLVIWNSQQPSATVVIDSAWGWYDVLCRVAQENVHIEYEVFVKSFGFMGKYRFSTQTGLCYTGSHDIHLLGNVPVERYYV